MMKVSSITIQEICTKTRRYLAYSKSSWKGDKRPILKDAEHLTDFIIDKSNEVEKTSREIEVAHLVTVKTNAGQFVDMLRINPRTLNPEPGEVGAISRESVK